MTEYDDVEAVDYFRSRSASVAASFIEIISHNARNTGTSFGMTEGAWDRPRGASMLREASRNNQGYNSLDVEMTQSNHSTHPAQSANYSNDRNSKIGAAETAAIPASTSWLQTIVVWLTVIGAILSGASIGPIFKYLSSVGIPSCLAACWRCQAASLILIPFAAIEAYSNESKRVRWLSRLPDTNQTIIAYVTFAGFLWSMYLVCWVKGLQYVSSFKASVFSSLDPLILCFWFTFNGVSLSKFEWLGVFVCFVGVALSGSEGVWLPEDEGAAVPQDGEVVNDGEINEGTSVFNNDSNRHRSDPVLWEMLGLFLCVLASIAQVSVVLNRILIRPHVPIWQYTAATTIVVMIVTAFVTLMTDTYEDRSIEVFCTHSWCIFGCFSKEWFPTMILFGFFIGVFCNTGLNYAMQYISPLAFCAVVLFDPTCTAILSWLSGIEALPRWYSWIGGLTVMIGVCSIFFGEQQRSKFAIDAPVAVSDSVLPIVTPMPNWSDDESEIGGKEEVRVRTGTLSEISLEMLQVRMNRSRSMQR